ncbi:Mucin-associated surface protein (MASP) [Trypanosoma cruzi]|uniref:Mucin-associated surface protein (MASP), putative n=2 Tax=Trypanosoma cruzi TaxID=5693 RepID=Q4DVW7_TRYCC|nr:mucin-associated surface protein (MASP), putative [Trypanosoma cruzi]EAN96682.1 mucin-associated surface protein (MASP), putative [Trypanosoma cruzi]PWV19885.1 Mucin-associated surface protein (MASP) [Trypanosoma cruzi]RNC56163.1 mucin-associated surface protein (MASP) [Trypanosoma cruzi]|eukprot:XP_818533.1 mucin-associated surface protein (MASP) [Trypanosoma cruzi strain CL Brener]
MAMMMTGRVLLVCALCVLWSGIDGVAETEEPGIDVAPGVDEYLVVEWRAQLRRECAEEVSRRTGGRANVSAVEECLREGMESLHAVVDGRRRWRPQRYALVAKDPEDGPPEVISVGAPPPLPGQKTQGSLQELSLGDPEKLSEGGAGGGTGLGSEQMQPEELAVTKQNESEVEGELIRDENNSELEKKVLVDSDLTKSQTMNVPEIQPEAVGLLLPSRDGRAAGIPGGDSSELSSEVSRLSEASGTGGDDQQKNTPGKEKQAAAETQPVPVAHSKPSGSAGTVPGEGGRLEDLLPQAPVKETAPAAPSPRESFHTASSPAKEGTESTQPADVLLKQGNIPTTDATQNATTEGQEETTSSSSAADDDNAVTNDADEGNEENSGDDSASRAAVPDEKQQREREDGNEKERAPAATPQVKNEDLGSADVVSVQQEQKTQSGLESGNESRKEDSVLTTNKQQDGTSDSHAESTPTSRSSAKSVGASNGPDKATEEEISNTNTARVDAVPEAAQDDGNKDDNKKETPVESTAIANDTTPTSDSDGSTAVSHTTSPLLLLLLVVVACAAAAAVVAA